MDVLRLSSEQHEWLQGLSGAPFEEENLGNFVSELIEALFDPERPISLLEKVKGGSDVEELAVKRGIAGLSSLIIESAKRDSAADAVGLYLQAIGMSEGRCNAIVCNYSQKKAQLRQLLSTVGFALPQIVDVDWRLDYCLKSKDTLQTAEQHYQINLQTFSQNDGFGNVGFGATTEELQELLWKLKEAVKAVERHTQS